MTTFLEAAISYAECDLRVFPLAAGGKAPLISGDRGGQGYHDATLDQATIRQWWTEAPEANIGIACEPSGLVVIDIDPRNGGNETLLQLEQELGELPHTVTTETGGGGRHFFFHLPPQTTFRGSLGPGVDVKAKGHVVAPPSQHPDGPQYRWLSPPWAHRIADLPPSWLGRMRKPNREAEPSTRPAAPYCPQDWGRYGASAMEKECQEVKNASPGQRNDRLNRAAFKLAQLAAGGMVDEETARQVLLSAALKAGLGEREAQATMKSGWEKGRDYPRVPVRQPPEPKTSCSSTARLSVTTLNDRPPEPTKWIVQYLVPEESCIIVGAEEKSGKTWLLFLLAICVATGKKFMDHEIQRTGKVLIYSPESGLEAKRARLWGLCWEMGLEPREVLSRLIFVSSRLDLKNSQHVDQLHSHILEYKPVLLILDPFITCAQDIEENSSSDVQEVLNTIRDLGLVQPGLGVLVAHHLSKGHKDRSAFHGFRGSSALGAWADGRISIQKISPSDPQSIRRVDVEHRDAPSPAPFGFTIIQVALSFEICAPNGVFGFRLEKCEPPEPQEAKIKGGRTLDKDLKNQIFLYVTNSKTLQTRASAAAEMGMNRPKFNRYFNELCHEGRCQLEDGKYLKPLK